MKTISVAKDFSRYPAGRFREDGPYSGQAFREDFLQGPLQQNEDVEVHLDGTRGYGSSFLEEAFGGLVREGISEQLILAHIKLVTDDPALSLEILEYIKNADG